MLPETIEVPVNANWLDRSVLFSGPANKRHWGIFLTEGLSRFWALEHPDLPSDLAVLGGRQAAKEAGRDFISVVLHHGGIERERVLVTDMVTVLPEVFVPHPSFAIRGQAFSAHALLPERVAEEICGNSCEPSEQPVYLTRSRLTAHKQRNEGEGAFDAILAERGVKVVAPETLSFEDQVRLVNRHSTFIGCVGSAFHSLLFAAAGRRLRTVVIGHSVNPHYATYVMFDLLKRIEAHYVYVPPLERTRRDKGPLDVDSAKAWLEALGVIEGGGRRSPSATLKALVGEPIVKRGESATPKLSRKARLAESAEAGQARGEAPGGIRDYVTLLRLVHAHLRPRTYVEIGVAGGRSLARAQPGTLCIGIDPEPNVRRKLPPLARLFEVTSDEFFADHDVTSLLQDYPIDLAFIDGMHLFEYALRDFINLEKACGEESVIVVHDCNPPNARVAARKRETGFWTGDVWKLIPCLKEHRPDLEVTVFDVPHRVSRSSRISIPRRPRSANGTTGSATSSSISASRTTASSAPRC